MVEQSVGAGAGGNGAKPASVGERRVITALFCDVVNSTTLAEELDPEDWTDIMNGAFRHLTAPVHRYEGTVNKLMGDALLAFFGDPVAHEDDPQRAVLAGLAIIESIKNFREEVKRDYGLDFDVRVGINTGPVVVSDVGHPRAVDHTALGDAVNVAARMEQTAAPATVQISADTYRLVAPLFDFEELGPIELKGKKDPVQAYRVLGVKLAPGRLRGLQGVSAPMIGRDLEFERLKQVLSQVRQGRGQIVSLIGEAGLGKSRLVSELHNYWMAEGQGGWTPMAGIPYDTSRPFGLFQNMARSFFGIQLEDPPETIHRKVHDYLVSTGASDYQVALCSVAFERVIAAKALHEAPDFPAEVVRKDIYDNMLPGLRDQAQRMPTVVLVDDLHWADTASVDLLVHLMQLVDEVPILFLFSFRPERQAPGWQVKIRAETDHPHRYTEVALKPLDHEDSDALISALLNIADLPNELRELILRKADGNPYFIEEIVRTLIDDGVVYQTEDKLHWKAGTRVEDIHIPDTLQALLMARIDRLDQEAKATLQLASVIGRSFYYRILQAISDSAMTLDRHLGSLERVELLREATRLPELEYAFRHELARDAAYGSILNRRRREFHRKVGEAIETLFNDRLEEQAHRLAQHFSLASDHQRAMCYFEMAGDAAAGVHADAESADNYGRAVEAARQLGVAAEEVARIEAKRVAMIARETVPLAAHHPQH